MAGKYLSPANRVLLALLVLSVLMTFVPVAFLVFFGMAPTIVVGIIDNRRERYKTICIGSLNIIGILPSALKMFDQDHSFERAFALLADSSTWLVILSATGAGIGIAVVGPAIISMFYVARLEKKSRQLKDYQKNLRDEWGDEVSEKVR